MPQMYPLSWMLMMPLSIFVSWIYLVMVYYLVSYYKFEITIKFFKKTLGAWEW